jgi:biopolymer transport protein ExbD
VIKSRPVIDLAPMLDFVTNLLIFFIITAVFVKEAGLEVNRRRRSSNRKRKTRRASKSRSSRA